MNKIDINRIAVKFDVENTTEELFDSVVNKFVSLGYENTHDWARFENLKAYSNLLIDEDDELVKTSGTWKWLRMYTVMSPQEFLALGNESNGAGSVSSDNNTIIVEWLNKLQYVFNKDVTLQSFDYSTIHIETDFGDIRGAEEIVTFINCRYDEFMTEENTQKQTELEAKREQLLAELAEIDKQLGGAK